MAKWNFLVVPIFQKVRTILWGIPKIPISRIFGGMESAPVNLPYRYVYIYFLLLFIKSIIYTCPFVITLYLQCELSSGGGIFLGRFDSAPGLLWCLGGDERLNKQN